ncbi:MAG: hypothetical protein P8M53_05595 [Pirellulales bacterium]|nr:hypothetical protein [Pirellulales bacterium]
MMRWQSVWCLFFVGMMTLLSDRCAGEPPGLQVWWTDYGSAYRLAEKEEKPLLVVFEAFDFPGPALQASLELKQSPSSSLLSPYILCRIDTSTKSGRDLARQFAAPGLPSVVITDKRLKRVIYRRPGPLSDLDWAVMLVSYRTGESLADRTSQPSEQRTVCYT